MLPTVRGPDEHASPREAIARTLLRRKHLRQSDNCIPHEDTPSPSCLIQQALLHRRAETIAGDFTGFRKDGKVGGIECADLVRIGLLTPENAGESSVSV